MVKDKLKKINWKRSYKQTTTHK